MLGIIPLPKHARVCDSCPCPNVEVFKLCLAYMLPVTVAVAPLWRLFNRSETFLRRVPKPTHDFAVFEETPHPNNLRKPDTRTRGTQYPSHYYIYQRPCILLPK